MIERKILKRSQSRLVLVKSHIQLGRIRRDGWRMHSSCVVFKFGRIVLIKRTMTSISYSSALDFGQVAYEIVPIHKDGLAQICLSVHRNIFLILFCSKQASL